MEKSDPQTTCREMLIEIVTAAGSPPALGNELYQKAVKVIADSVDQEKALNEIASFIFPPEYNSFSGHFDWTWHAKLARKIAREAIGLEGGTIA